MFHADYRTDRAFPDPELAWSMIASMPPGSWPRWLTSFACAHRDSPERLFSLSLQEGGTGIAARQLSAAECDTHISTVAWETPRPDTSSDRSLALLLSEQDSLELVQSLQAQTLGEATARRQAARMEKKRVREMLRQEQALPPPAVCTVCTSDFGPGPACASCGYRPLGVPAAADVPDAAVDREMEAMHRKRARREADERNVEEMRAIQPFPPPPPPASAGVSGCEYLGSGSEEEEEEEEEDYFFSESEEEVGDEF